MENGVFISSGIIKDRKDEIVNILKENNFEIVEVKEKGEWVAIVAK